MVSNVHNKRLYEIDTLRFLAAILVVFFHFDVGTYLNYKTYLVESSILNDFFAKGNLGVRLFFIISGFVIVMSAQSATPLGFIKSRALRLYPAFVPICIFTFIIGNFFDEGYKATFQDFFINLTLIGTFASNFKVKLVSGVYWTLIIEMQFYFFIFLLIYFRHINNIRKFLLLWLVLSIITYYGEIYFNFYRFFNKVRIIFITQHSFYFISGCYFYLIKFQRKRYDVLMPFITLIFTLKCFINYPYYTLTSGTAWFIVIFFLLFYYISLKESIPLKNYHVFETLGSITYPLYLIHEELGALLIGLLLPIIDKTAILILLVIFMVLIAYCFNILIERPLTTFFKRKLYFVKAK